MVETFFFQLFEGRLCNLNVFAYIYGGESVWNEPYYVEREMCWLFIIARTAFDDGTEKSRLQKTRTRDNNNSDKCPNIRKKHTHSFERKIHSITSPAHFISARIVQCTLYGNVSALYIKCTHVPTHKKCMSLFALSIHCGDFFVGPLWVIFSHPVKFLIWWLEKAFEPGKIHFFPIPHNLCGPLQLNVVIRVQKTIWYAYCLQHAWKKERKYA